MKNRQHFVAGILLAFMLLLGCQMAVAQGIITGSMSGTVVDSTGAIIPGAQITAKHVATGTVFNATTNDTGYFQLLKLPPGAYEVTVQAGNFRTVKFSGTTVLVAQETSLGKISMQIGGKSEVVEVTGAAPLIETQTSQLSMTFDSKKVTDLPIGRGIDQLTLFLPGVSTAGSVGRGNNNGALFSANGQRPRSNNFQIDGQGMNDASVTGPAIFLENNDIVAEYQVMTNYDASYGRNLGSQVNVITKSGTNSFHGTAVYTWRGSTFDSLTNQEKNPILGYCTPSQNPATDGCTAPKISRYVRNTPSFTFGGPIVRNKAWFFGSGLWDRIRTAGSPTTSGSLVTPTSAGIAALAAAFPNSPGVKFLQSSFGPLQTAGNPVITQTGTKTVTVGGTTVQVPVGTLVRNVSSTSNVTQYTARGDVQLSQKDRLFGRYLIDDEPTTNLDYGDGPQGFFMDVPSRGQQIGVDWTRQWSNTFLNQVRFNWTKLRVTFGNGTSPCDPNNPAKCPISIGFSDATLLPMGVASNFPQGRTNKTYEVQDNANWTHGKHSFKFGGYWSNQHPTSIFLPSYNGVYTFADLSAFVANTPSRLSGANGSFIINYKENDLAFYFQDDIRLSPTFTVTAGLRWEYYQNTINQLHDQTVAQQTGPNPFWNTSLPLSLTTIHHVPEDYNNLGPVIGFSWNARDKMVVRGGFRIAYDPSFYNIQLNVSSNAPVVNSTTLATSSGDVVPGMPSSGFDGNAARPTFQSALPTGVNPGLRTQSLVADNFHNPYSEQWNIGIQYELNPKAVIETRYLGNHGVGLFQNLNGNIALNPYITNGWASIIPPGLTPCTTTGAPGSNLGYVDCNRRNVNLRTNTAGNSYNGLQSRFDVRAWHGVTATVSYTWSHNIDNASDIYSTTGAGMMNVPQNPFDNGYGERGNSNFDYRHTVGLQFVYDVPFFQKQEGILGKALGGWQANVTYRYSTGQPYTPIETRGSKYGNSSVSFCDPSSLFSTATDACRPILANPNAPFNSVGYISAINAGVPTVLNMVGDTPTTLTNVHWLVNNPMAAKYFGTPFAGVGRNTLTGQPIQATNLSMQKGFKLTERFNLQFRATAFNVLNHMFLGVPGNNIMRASTSFGNWSYNNSGGGNASSLENGLERRRLEFGAKIIF
jgi:outer membrane receptor protein involved in Fe transport